jgi:hypothetical protein
MQGLVKGIFCLERCWMRGHRHDRWLFAAMAITVQLHQAKPFGFYVWISNISIS